ncbi:sulfotransferase family protein [Catenovulum sediminis]|uniref:Sulfotransferase family protein n=1 Tax=Catenovulum sediminis TaxID=1740262 RepID=A0ABV1RFV6_9ALTE|nr:sulfotransferase family protein [Catenovulum sediminis]
MRIEKWSTKLKVFGIGWAKTGTTTLGSCLEQLGYDHQSQDLELVKHLQTGDLTPVFQTVARYESFEDWPWIVIYKELDKQFPNSKFILTERAPEKWVASYTNMLEKLGEASEEMNQIRSTLYNLPFPDVNKEMLLARYQQHNQEVKAYFADRPDDLLVVNWEQGDGWPELCQFLQKKIPDQAFPHANKGRYQKPSLLSKVASLFKS